MKLPRSLFLCLGLLSITTGAFAAAPATNAAPTSSAPAEKQAAPSTNAPAATPPAAVPATHPVMVTSINGFKFDDYINDLTMALKLSDSEKKNIESYYLGDGVQLQNILNYDSLSPFQQAQQVADLRSARNDKIEALLHDLDRQQEFLRIEAQYRVALTMLAAEGGLVDAAPPATK